MASKNHHLQNFISEDGMAKCREDQDSADYTREGQRLLTHVSGWYSVEELESKLRQLKEANELFETN